MQTAVLICANRLILASSFEKYLRAAVLPDAVPAQESHSGVSFSLARRMRYFAGKHIPSDGHEVFNVLRCLRLNFSKKTPTFPYIREEGKVGEKADFSTLLDTKRKIMI
jgi:hypothetical protein